MRPRFRPEERIALIPEDPVTGPSDETVEGQATVAGLLQASDSMSDASLDELSPAARQLVPDQLVLVDPGRDHLILVEALTLCARRLLEVFLVLPDQLELLDCLAIDSAGPFAPDRADIVAHLNALRLVCVWRRPPPLVGTGPPKAARKVDCEVVARAVSGALRSCAVDSRVAPGGPRLLLHLGPTLPLASAPTDAERARSAGLDRRRRVQGPAALPPPPPVPRRADLPAAARPAAVRAVPVDFEAPSAEAVHVAVSGVAVSAPGGAHAGSTAAAAGGRRHSSCQGAGATSHGREARERAQAVARRVSDWQRGGGVVGRRLDSVPDGRPSTATAAHGADGSAGGTRTDAVSLCQRCTLQQRPGGADNGGRARARVRAAADTAADTESESGADTSAGMAVATGAGTHGEDPHDARVRIALARVREAEAADSLGEPTPLSLAVGARPASAPRPPSLRSRHVLPTSGNWVRMAAAQQEGGKARRVSIATPPAGTDGTFGCEPRLSASRRWAHQTELPFTRRQATEDVLDAPTPGSFLPLRMHASKLETRTRPCRSRDAVGVCPDRRRCLDGATIIEGKGCY